MAGDRSPEESNRRAGDAEDAALSARLKRLGERLDTLSPPGRGREDKGDPRASADPSSYGRAMRLSSEFIGGIVGGAFIGWLLDFLAGTTPWGLIVFLLLGFAAGTLNVLRSAGVAAPRSTTEKND